MKPFSSRSVLVVALGVCLASSTAFADLVPPDVSACSSATAGQACMLSAGSAGTCRMDTCSRLDYANWNRDAMSAPPSMSFACLRCVAGGGGTDAGPSPSMDASDGTDAGMPARAGGCSVAKGTGNRAAKTAGSWLLAGVFAGVVTLVSRRARRR